MAEKYTVDIRDKGADAVAVIHIDGGERSEVRGEFYAVCGYLESIGAAISGINYRTRSRERADRIKRLSETSGIPWIIAESGLVRL